MIGAPLIRAAEPHHLPDIVRIERENFPDPWSAGLLQRKITDPAILFLVAQAEDRLLGYGLLQLIAPEAELINIAVDQTVRRQGVGRALLTALLEEASAHGVTTVHLEVRASNAPALTLYEALGFRPIGRRRGYYQNPCEDAILMTRTKEPA